MDALLGTSFGVFVGVTVVLTGFAAFMTGQAIANTWRPFRQVPIYCLLLAGVARFLIWGLFGGALWSASGYLIGSGVLVTIGAFAYFSTRARKMVCQYPWLYERAGVFGWRARGGGTS